MEEDYFRGVFAAYLGASFISGFVAEWQIDMIKESISRYNETMIDGSQLSYQEKENKKHLMKRNLEAYIYGVKDTLTREGRLVKG